MPGKAWSYTFLGAAIPLFLIGITLHYLLGLTPGGVQNLIQVDQYLSFVMAMMLAFELARWFPGALRGPVRAPIFTKRIGYPSRKSTLTGRLGSCGCPGSVVLGVGTGGRDPAEELVQGAAGVAVEVRGGPV
jgi:hypothetical protein